MGVGLILFVWVVSCFGYVDLFYFGGLLMGCILIFKLDSA